MRHPTPIWLKKWELKGGQRLSPKTEFKPIARYIDVSCKQCGRIIKLTETKAKKYWAGFCSKKCADDAKRTGLSVKKICVYCGDEYKVKPCAKKSRYCSQECHGLDKRKPWANADNRERHKKEYLKWRMKVLVRDNFTCNDCKKEGDIAHHLELFGKYPEKRFDIENGITLCKRCHLKRHMKELHQ